MITLHKAQSELALDTRRFKVWRAGRRIGKSTYAIEETKGVAVLEGKEQFNHEANILYIATTQIQARKIVWRPLKKEFENAGAKINEARLEIETPNKYGSKSYISLMGWENIDTVRGQGFDLIIIDELDSLTNFLQEFQETVKPLVLDRKGKIIFIGTPKDSNPNLQSLENTYRNDPDWAFYHSTSYDNPFLDHAEIDKEKEALSLQSFRQEWLAEYGDGSTRLFDPVAVDDMFRITLSNTDKTPYYIIDPAGQGEDKTATGLWKGFECWIDEKSHLSSDDIENDILVKETSHQIPRANIMLDSVGIGDSIQDRARLKGVTVFKGSFAPIKTDKDISKAIDTGIHTLKPTQSDFANLRAQTYYALANKVNTRQIKVHCSVEQAEEIKRELNATVEMEGKGKTQIIPKEDIKRIVGHSPDKSDVLAMRMYYDIIGSVSMFLSISPEMRQRQEAQFARNRSAQRRQLNSTR